MRVVVTRPGHEAQQWVERLARAGLDAVQLPLIGIEALAEPAPLRRAWRDARQCHALMFVSAAAVRHFFASRPADVPHWPDGVRAWAPGRGTGAVLLQHGVPAAQLDCPAADSEQFDSEHLWQVVSGQAVAGRQVLVLRGTQDDAPPRSAGPRATGQVAGTAADGAGDVAAGADTGSGRDWLAQRLRERGVQVDVLACYRRVVPQPDAAQAALAHTAAADGSCWLFSSSQAVANLLELFPGIDWSGARALATHPRIAAAARAAGFGTVHTSRPDPDSVAASIKSPA